MRKKLSIALLSFSLAMICANFIVRRVKGFFPSQQNIEEEGKEFSPFAMVKQDKEDNAIINSPSFILKPQKDSIEIGSFAGKEIVKPVLQTELTQEEKQIIETNSKNPKMKEFVEEIFTVISPEELEQENYLQIAYKPEVRNIFVKYIQDKDFREIASKIMKNKHLLQLAKKTINNNEVKK